MAEWIRVGEQMTTTAANTGTTSSTAGTIKNSITITCKASKRGVHAGEQHSMGFLRPAHREWPELTSEPE